jgi:high-affinity Fe2+/Pb2+ permease
MQMDKDMEMEFSEQFKKQQREATFKLGQEVISLSTKAKNDKMDVPDEILDAESHYRNLLTELEMTQRRYMLSQQQKDRVKMKKQARITKGNVKGNVNDAKAQLNEFVGDSERDVKQMECDLLET